MSVAEAFPLGGSVGRLRPQTMGLCGEPPRAMVLKLGPPQDGRSDPTRLSLRVASGTVHVIRPTSRASSSKTPNTPDAVCHLELDTNPVEVGRPPPTADRFPRTRTAKHGLEEDEALWLPRPSSRVADAGRV